MSELSDLLTPLESPRVYSFSYSLPEEIFTGSFSALAHVLRICATTSRSDTVRLAQFNSLSFVFLSAILNIPIPYSTVRRVPHLRLPYNTLFPFPFLSVVFLKNLSEGRRPAVTKGSAAARARSNRCIVRNWPALDYKREHELITDQAKHSEEYVSSGTCCLIANKKRATSLFTV